MEVLESLVGVAQRQKNGLMCEVVEHDESTGNIKYVFENGYAGESTVAKFEGGNIRLTMEQSTESKVCAFRLERLHEKKLQHCGFIAEIIAYRCASDIDVQFDDGTVKVGCSYFCFKQGNISNPNRHIDESEKMNCGKYCKIIAYRNISDIDVEFEDGFIKTKCSYSAFKRGRIAHSERGVQCSYNLRCGLTVVPVGKTFKKNGSTYIEVVFEDGARKNVHLWSLRTGRISYSTGIKFKFNKVYTKDFTRYYTLEYKYKRYVGSLAEIVSELKKDGVIEDD